MLFFFCFVIVLGWIFSQIYHDATILVFAVIFSLLMNIVSYWYSDKLVLGISGAKLVALKDNPELYRIVENLAITAGLPTPKIYIIEEPQPNAFATGRNKEHAVVVVTRGLLNILENEELEGVIAHELSHIGNYDMLVSTIAVVLVGSIALLSDWFLRASFFGRRSNNEKNENGILIIIGFALSILAPIIATLLRLAISRKREFLADASGVLLTRYPEGLAKALEKIGGSHTPLAVANNATAHLYISNPFRGQEALSALSSLFQTHPPMKERIKRLREMGI